MKSISHRCGECARWCVNETLPEHYFECRTMMCSDGRINGTNNPVLYSQTKPINICGAPDEFVKASDL